jgi:hypothetical protein
MIYATNRQLYLDHGRVFIECPRLMLDDELAVVLKAFVAEIEARPPKRNVSMTLKQLVS